MATKLHVQNTHKKLTPCINPTFSSFRPTYYVEQSVLSHFSHWMSHIYIIFFSSIFPIEIKHLKNYQWDFVSLFFLQSFLVFILNCFRLFFSLASKCRRCSSETTKWRWRWRTNHRWIVSRSSGWWIFPFIARRWLPRRREVIW